VCFLYILFKQDWDYLALDADKRINDNKQTLNRPTELIPDHEPISIQ